MVNTEPRISCRSTIFKAQYALSVLVVVINQRSQFKIKVSNWRTRNCFKGNITIIVAEMGTIANFMLHSCPARWNHERWLRGRHCIDPTNICLHHNMASSWTLGVASSKHLFDHLEWTVLHILFYNESGKYIEPVLYLDDRRDRPNGSKSYSICQNLFFLSDFTTLP